MERLLNKSVLILMVFSCSFMSAQDKPYNEKEYHDKDEFKKFTRRADMVAAWQIQNLKFGAVVVRFQNNHKKIEAYEKAGDTAKANQVKAETQFYIQTLIRAFKKNFNFCKVYFMYTQNSDSLLRGARKGIFIDSTLKVNNQIVMTEKFYILAERDYVYNSSIGFVTEDTAKFIKENGNRTIDVAIVLKNKYGHQLKNPFPIFIKRSFLKSSSNYVNTSVTETAPGKFEKITYVLNKDITLAKQGEYIEDLNERLSQFYGKNQGEQINDPKIQPYLY